MAKSRNKGCGWLVIFIVLTLGVIFVIIAQDLNLQPGSSFSDVIKAIGDKVGRSLSRGIG